MHHFFYAQFGRGFHDVQCAQCTDVKAQYGVGTIYRKIHHRVHAPHGVAHLVVLAHIYMFDGPAIGVGLYVGQYEIAMRFHVRYDIGCDLPGSTQQKYFFHAPPPRQMASKLCCG